MKITWKLTHEAPADAAEPPVQDFTASDGEEVIGRVYQITEGPDRGLWFWTMTAVRSGPASAMLTSGRVAQRGKAGRCVVETYRLMVEQSWKARVRPHRG